MLRGLNSETYTFNISKKQSVLNARFNRQVGSTTFYITLHGSKSDESYSSRTYDSGSLRDVVYKILKEASIKGCQAITVQFDEDDNFDFKSVEAVVLETKKSYFYNSPVNTSPITVTIRVTSPDSINTSTLGQEKISYPSDFFKQTKNKADSLEQKTDTQNVGIIQQPQYPKENYAGGIGNTFSSDYDLVNEEIASCTDRVNDENKWSKGTEYKALLCHGRFVIPKPNGDMPGSYETVPRTALQTDSIQHQEDLSADIAVIGNQLVLGASLRGASFYSEARVRQDNYAIGEQFGTDDTKWVIAVIADGVSEASDSHQLSKFLSRNTVEKLKSELEGRNKDDFKLIDWTKIANTLVDEALRFCKSRAPSGWKVQDYLKRWASTLELVIVEANSFEDRSYISVTIAGDGAIYIIDPVKGWFSIKATNTNQESMASNDVVALPGKPGDPQVVNGMLETNQSIFLTTDGLGKRIGRGKNQLGGFLQYELLRCTSLIDYVRIIDVSVYQGSDDKTGILIKGYANNE
ncbi:MAG: protein phosphatase 2C domain-containing protein [Coriobacteriia bacterium]|nr:protein phosphatase 2C domain-containing protein [Coriobacteriia bacterium]